MFDFFFWLVGVGVFLMFLLFLGESCQGSDAVFYV